MPAALIHEAKGNCNPWTYACWISSNAVKGEFECLLVATLGSEQGHT